VETSSSVVLPLVAFLFVSFIIHKSKGNEWYTLPVIWGLMGIIVANVIERQNYAVAIASICAVLAILGVLSRENWTAPLIVDR